MSSVQTYWEKYREKSKSPIKTEPIDTFLTNIHKDRISELQSQVNILEDRLVNLSRQVKLQQNESLDIFETVSKINKIDKVLELNDLLNKKTQSHSQILENLSNWEPKVQQLIEAAEKRLLSFIIEKFEEFDKKIQKFDSKFQKTLKSDFHQFEDIRAKIRKTSKSPETLRKKLEEVSEIQEKLQKVVINTAEKVKLKEKEGLDSSRFSVTLDKISSLLKKYSKAQHILFQDVKDLQVKTKSLESRIDSSHSFIVSDRKDSRLSNDNFKLSFGSEDSKRKI